MKKLLMNPLVLRDLGWAYRRPFLGLIPIKTLTFWTVFALTVTILSIAIWLEVENGGGAGGMALVGFASLFLFLLLLRCPFAAATSWSKDRELHVLPELILTGLTAEEFAQAKIFARGFVFIGGSIAMSVLYGSGLVWVSVLDSSYFHIYDDDFLPWAMIHSWMMIAMPLIISCTYMRLLRLGLTGTIIWIKCAVGFILWGVSIPFLWFLHGVFMLLIANEQLYYFLDFSIGFVYLFGLFYALMFIIFFVSMIIASYRVLLNSIAALYLAATD